MAKKTSSTNRKQSSTKRTTGRNRLPSDDGDKDKGTTGKKKGKKAGDKKTKKKAGKIKNGAAAASDESSNGQEKTGRGDRQPDGTFRKGNPGGNGNPYAGPIAKMRKEMIESYEEGTFKRHVEILENMADGGDLRAIRLLWQYRIGKPKEQDKRTPEELDVDERRGQEFRSSFMQAREATARPNLKRPDDQFTSEAVAVLKLGAPVESIPRFLGTDPARFNAWVKQGQADIEAEKFKSPEAKLHLAVQRALAEYMVDQTIEARRHDPGLKLLERRDPDNYGRRRAVMPGDEEEDVSDGDERWL